MPGKLTGPARRHRHRTHTNLSFQEAKGTVEVKLTIDRHLQMPSFVSSGMLEKASSQTAHLVQTPPSPLLPLPPQLLP